MRDRLVEAKRLNKSRMVVAILCIIIVVMGAYYVVRMMGQLMSTATEGFSAPGETLIQTETEWVAPTMPLQSLEDIDAGLTNVQSDTKDNLDTAQYDSDDEMVSVPVDETVDQLADTTPVPDMPTVPDTEP